MSEFPVLSSPFVLIDAETVLETACLSNKPGKWRKLLYLHRGVLSQGNCVVESVYFVVLLFVMHPRGRGGRYCVVSREHLMKCGVCG